MQEAGQPYCRPGRLPHQGFRNSNNDLMFWMREACKPSALVDAHGMFAVSRA
jgi:hypothetical protein